jgi:hypothetical protein
MEDSPKPMEKEFFVGFELISMTELPWWKFRIFRRRRQKFCIFRQLGLADERWHFQKQKKEKLPCHRCSRSIHHRQRVDRGGPTPPPLLRVDLSSRALCHWCMTSIGAARGQAAVTRPRSAPLPLGVDLDPCRLESIRHRTSSPCRHLGPCAASLTRTAPLLQMPPKPPAWCHSHRHRR